MSLPSSSSWRTSATPTAATATVLTETDAARSRHQAALSTLSAGRTLAFSLLMIVGAATVLAVPALWNGFPILYYDTMDYVRLPFTDQMLPVYRTAGYGLITAIADINDSLWPILILQCLIMGYVLHEILCVFLPRQAPAVVMPVTVTLSLLTGLPWYASQLMADIFTGALVLSMAALAFGGHRLPLWRRLLLTAVAAVAVAVHTTHIAIAAGLVLSFLGLWLITAWQRWEKFRPTLRLPLLVLVGGLFLAASSNWHETGRFFIRQPNDILLMARLIQDGIAKRYLDDVCPTNPSLKMCSVRDQLPHTANEFLWGNSPFYRLGYWNGLEEEAGFIVRDSLRRYPGLHLITAFKLTLEQLGMLKTGDGLVNVDWHMRAVLLSYFPGDYEAYLTSRQRTGISFVLWNTIHVPVAVLSCLALLPLLILAWRRQDRLVAGLCLTMLLAVLGNAFVCGALSNPLDRYQSRIAWGTALAMGVAVMRLGARRPETEPVWEGALS